MILQGYRPSFGELIVIQYYIIVPLHFSYSYHFFFFWFEIFHLTSDIASFHYITDTHNDHFSVHKIDNSESTVRLAEGIGASPTPRQPDPARLLGSELAPPPPPTPQSRHSSPTLSFRWFPTFNFRLPLLLLWYPLWVGINYWTITTGLLLYFFHHNHIKLVNRRQYCCQLR